MKNARKVRSIFTLLIVTVLVAVVALSSVSCSKEKGANNDGNNAAPIAITVEVVNKAGESTEHEITTSADNLADALTEAGIASGDESEYGLYITTVDGEVADYSVDGSYWSISQNGETLMTGASATKISDGDHYELTYTVAN